MGKKYCYPNRNGLMSICGLETGKTPLFQGVLDGRWQDPQVKVHVGLCFHLGSYSRRNPELQRIRPEDRPDLSQQKLGPRSSVYGC